MTATEVEARVKERMEKERKELAAEKGEAEKQRGALQKEYEKATVTFDKHSDEMIALDDGSKPIPEALQAKAEQAHKDVLRTMNATIAASNRIARLADKLAALDDPKELKRRVEQAQKFEKLREQHGGDLPEGEKPPRMTGKRAAQLILKQAGQPLHYREITRMALEGGLIKTGGKTPDATMNALLATSAKAGDTFVRISPGVFGLAEVKEDGKVEAVENGDKPKETTPAKKKTAAKAAAAAK